MSKKINVSELKGKILLSRQEAAAYINVGVSNMEKIFRRPDFPPLVRIGHLVFVKRELLDEWIDNQMTK